ncbi:bacteriocin immunity protein [Pseudomonas sp. CC120222-01a]|uniref:bacteriocin immunity protein n=1 Tax=Pseudomonas sp. CC120222-01a TaxID=1378075 RepID=UPI000D8452BF|nr:bacteriocin immunity protein [Pseudomonas sp. CC120222-01a]PVZ40720.1 colicin immunity protein/pyocin immunity protein [Pseudomonas sp. CC120222-01a]
MILKSKIEEYSEAEFTEFLNEFFENPSRLKGDALGAHINRLSEHFESLTDHPDKSGLIFYPADGVEDSPAGVISVLKTWLAANGKPGFRES